MYFFFSRCQQLTSQHPYAEVFIGKPHVFTVDINNLTLVEETIKEILNTEVSVLSLPVELSVLLSYHVFVVVVLKVKPYLPHEWTPKGMLERVNAFSEYYVSVVGSNSLLSNRTVYLETYSPSPSNLSSYLE